MTLKDHVYLYVEDDELNRQALCAVLTRLLGVQNLSIFEDSKDFMPRVEALEQTPDVFLLDIQVRPHDGFEMIKMLRDHPMFHNARIIAVTAGVMNEQVDQIRASGFDGCIGKPLNLTTLPSALERIIEGEKIWQITS